MLALVLVLAAAPTAPAPATAQQRPQSADLADLDIDELGRIWITSTSRRFEQASRAAAAVYVINREDIRRSGAGSLPEALRLAPGLQVLWVTAHERALRPSLEQQVKAAYLLDFTRYVDRPAGDWGDHAEYGRGGVACGLRRGGMVAFVIVGEAVRFLIDDEAARRAGLRISSRVLALALRPEEAGEEPR